MDQPTGDPKTLFDAIVKELIDDRALEEMSRGKHEAEQFTAREFDNADHNGDNVPNASQMADAAEIMSKARELRRILRS